MVHLTEACEECTQNCHLMHKKDKNPSPVATTFFKIMFGDDYSKVLFLPPRFAHDLQNMVGKTTRLENSSGEKWPVKFSKIDGLMAFEEGWNTFASVHGLKVGDFLVFHYIMESYFVVLMYGQSGCPELRHFGLNRSHTKETVKITDHDHHKPSKVKTKTHHHLSHESPRSKHSDEGLKELRNKEEKNKIKGSSEKTKTHLSTPSSRPGPTFSSQGRSPRSKELPKTPPTVKHLVDEDVVIVEDDDGINSLDKRSKKKEKGPATPSVEKTKNTRDHLSASSSRPGPTFSSQETSPNFKKLLKTPPKTVNVENDHGRNCLDDFLIPKITSDVAVGKGGGKETQINKTEDVLEARSVGSREKPEKSNIVQSGTICNNSIKKRLRSSESPINRPKMAKKEPVLANEIDTSASRLHDKLNAKSMEVSKKELILNNGSDIHRPKMTKKEPILVNETDTSASRLHDKSKVTKKELILDNDLDVIQPKRDKKEPVTLNVIDTSAASRLHTAEIFSKSKGHEFKASKMSVLKSDGDILPPVKDEPLDYDEALPPGANSLFSAVMTTYEYLELPEWVKLKKVILLRNSGDLWPVLYQNKFGFKALTQSWGVYARKRGIQPGDRCEFVLESDANGQQLCSVFRVHVTSK